MQANGNALWLIAYFGYWLEIFLVIAIKLIRGKLTDAAHKRSPAVMRSTAEHQDQAKDKQFDDSASESETSSRPSSETDIKAKAKAKAIELPQRSNDGSNDKLGEQKPVPLDERLEGMDDKVPAWVAQDGAPPPSSPARPVKQSDFYV